MQIPSEIVASIREKKCILFLGAGIMSPAPPDSPFTYVESEAPPRGRELARHLMTRCGDCPEIDADNLQRVALFYQFRPGGGSREALVSAIREEITGPAIRPSPALHMLSALPFPIVITTNYDPLIDVALGRADTLDGRPKKPILRIYDPHREGPPESVPLDPTEENPILLKLHGDIGNPASIVVTEEDYIIFIQRMSDIHRHPIHENIRARMNSWPILFIGYSLRDYNLRLLFRTLRWHLDVAHFPLSFSVDPRPDDLIVSVWQRGEKPMVSFVRQDLWTFVPALFQECTGREWHDH